VAGRPVWQPSLDFGGNGELVFGGQVDSVYAGSLGIWTADVYQAATHEGDTVVDTVVLQLQLDLVESAGRAMVPVYVAAQGLQHRCGQASSDLGGFGEQV